MRRLMHEERHVLRSGHPHGASRERSNGSDYLRPESVVVYNRPWHTQPRHVEMTQPEFDRLSDRGKQMLARCRMH